MAWRCGALVENNMFQIYPISASPTINPRVCIVPEQNCNLQQGSYATAKQTWIHQRIAGMHWNQVEMFLIYPDLTYLNSFCYQLFSSRYFEAPTWPSGTEATSRRRLVMLVACESPRVTSDWEQDAIHRTAKLSTIPRQSGRSVPLGWGVSGQFQVLSHAVPQQCQAFRTRCVLRRGHTGIPRWCTSIG